MLQNVFEKFNASPVLSLRAYQSAKVDGVCFPLCCIISYMGLHLVALTELPVGRDTLVYGSDDGGVTVATNDTGVFDLVSYASRKLRLAEHIVAGGKVISSACDLEGHRGRDGRVYLLDFSRSLPPNEAGVGGEHLFRMFRQEFLQIYGKKLSADAFSRFQSDPVNNAEMNAAAIAAQKYLWKVHIPDAAERLLVLMHQYEREAWSFPLVQSMHDLGVNMRYLGLVMEHLAQGNSVADDDSSMRRGSAVLQDFDEKENELRLKLLDLIVLEVCSRGVKVYLRAALSNVVEAGQHDVLNRAIVSLLNTLLSSSIVGRESFEEKICPILRKNFNFPFRVCNPIGLIHSDDFAARWGHIGSLAVLRKVSAMMGLQFSEAALQVLKASPHLFRETSFLDIIDLEDVKPIVKHSNVIEATRGSLYALKAQVQASDAVKMHYLELAVKHFELAEPTGDLLVDYANVLYTYIGVVKRVELRAEEADRLLKILKAKAMEAFGRVLHYNHTDFAVRFQFAKCLDLLGEYDAADVRFLQALLLDPNDAPLLESYSHFLAERFPTDSMAQFASKKFRERVDELMQKYQSLAASSTDVDVPTAAAAGSTSPVVPGLPVGLATRRR